MVRTLWDMITGVDPDEQRDRRRSESVFAPIYSAAEERDRALAAEGRRPVLGGLLSKEPEPGIDSLRYEGVSDALLGLAQPVLQAVDAPYQAYQGNIPMEDMTGEAINLGGLLQLGGLTSMGSSAFEFDPNTTRIFAGPNAKTADLEAMRRAETMLDEGADRADVWRDTGWMRGPDGKMRFEIDDSRAVLRQKPRDVLNYGGEDYQTNYSGGLLHQELLGGDYRGETLPAAYPDMIGDMDFGRARSSSGSYDIGTGAIKVGAADAQSGLPVTIHELQHAVQAQEGFGRGSNPSIEFNNLLMARRALTSHLEKQIEQKQDELGLSGYAPQHPELEPLYERYNRLANKAVSEDDAFDIYHRVMGEVEARNAETRRAFSAEMRREIPPWETQDVPDEEQFMRYHDAEQSSVNRPGQPTGLMQMFGGDYFDAPNPNAGRSKDPALYTPFSKTKAKNAPAEWMAEGRYMGENTAPELITPEMQQGKRMFFAAGDRTAGDVEIDKVGRVPLRRPVRLNAGAEYMDTGDVWASHKGVMVPKHKVLQSTVEDGEDIGLAFMPMAERSGDFSRHQGELFSEMLYSSRMPRKSVAKVNETIKSIANAQAAKDLDRKNKARAKKGLKPLKRAKATKIPSVTSEDFREWFDNQSAEDIRKPVLEAMDAAPIKALEGVPDVGEARFAATNPNLVKSESYSAGFRFGTPDVARGLLASEHPTYDTKYTAKEGTRSQTYGQDIPWTIAARDTALPRIAEAARASGEFKAGQNTPFAGRRTTLPSDQRVFTMNPKTSQLIDDQYVEEASTYMDLARTQGRERAQEYEMGLIEQYLRGL